MLLSSPAFSTFLNDLSGTGAPASMPELQQTQHQSSSTQQNITPHKDVDPNQLASNQAHNQPQNNLHVGLTMIPEESSFDYNATGLNNAYTNNMDFGGLYDAQVYAVTSLPQGPAVDTPEFTMLHGKTSNFVGSYTDADDAKIEPAVFERMPTAEKMEMPEPIELPSQDDDIDTTDPSFALFVDQPSTAPSSMPQTVAPADHIFGDIELDKAFGRVELVVADETENIAEVSSATIERFERLCSRLEMSSSRIAAVTGRR